MEQVTAFLRAVLLSACSSVSRFGAPSFALLSERLSYLVKVKAALS